MDLLGRDVRRRAHDHVRRGQSVGVLALRDEAEAEVHHDRAVVPPVVALDEEVLGLQIAVDQRQRVRGHERVGDLSHDLQRAREGEQAAPHHARQRRPLEALHDEEEPARVLAEVVDLDRVRVAQGGGHAGLALEAGAGLLLRADLRVQQLDRDGAVELGLERLVDGAHAALAEQRADAVAAADDLAGLRERLAHHCTS